VEGVLFLVEKHSPERDWTVAPIHASLVISIHFFYKFLFSFILQVSCSVLLILQPRVPFLCKKKSDRD
jgi:hypothetical protein